MAFSNQFEDYSPQRPHPSSTPLWPFVVLLGLLAVGGLAGWWWTHQRSSGLDPEAQALPVAARGPLLSDEQTNIKLYEQNAPSVVHVTNLARSRGRFSLDVQQV